MLKKSIILVLTLCLAAALLAGCFNWPNTPSEPTTPNSPPAEKEGYVLDWQDEFDGDALDFKKWMPQYLPHATTSSDGFMADYAVSNGSLKLMINENRPTFYESDKEEGFKVSGIQTFNKFSLHEQGKSSAMVAPYNGYTTQYGYFEIRCKLPAGGGGGHVAFWMVGTQADARADGSGSLQTGEIDIIETPFYEPNVHFPRVFSWTDEDLTTWYDAVPLEGDYVNDWHTFALDWRPEYLAFYVDGVEVSRTEQSPQYEMCMILSMYINDNPNDNYVFGLPSDVYPKVWEIDYVRVYKDENGYPNGVTKPTDPVPDEIIPENPDMNELDGLYNLALDATVTASDAMSKEGTASDLKRINDGMKNEHSYARFADGTELVDDWLQLNWAEPISLNRVVLYNQFSGQAPTQWEVLVSTDGEAWTSVGEIKNPEWSDDRMDGIVLKFDKQDNVVAVRVKIKMANIIWGHYCVYEIEAFDTSKKIPLKNHSIDATVSVSENMPCDDGSSDINRVADGVANEHSYYRTADGTECVDDYVQFLWENPVSVNKVVFYNQWSGQAPTAWDILVTTDGETWNKVAEIKDVEWSEGDLEGKTLEFALQENIVGLRVQIKAANLIWGGYSIYGIDIFGTELEDITPDTEPEEVPKSLAPSATATVAPGMPADEFNSNINRVTDDNVTADSYYRPVAEAAAITEFENEYVQLVWDTPVSVNKVIVYNQFSGQAPIAWDILVSADGETWNKVAEMKDVEWSADQMEGKELEFDMQEDIVGLRVQIKAANTEWGHYTIYGIELAGMGIADALPEEGEGDVEEGEKSLAPSATVTVAPGMPADDFNSNINRVTDDNVTADSYFRPVTEAVPVTEFEDEYVQLVWENPVSVNQVILYNQFSGQAPIAWDILVTTDGNTWNKVAEIANVEWSADQLEGKTLNFALQENIVGLRVQIKAANTEWGHYTIYGIELNNVEPPKSFATTAQVTVSANMPAAGIELVADDLANQHSYYRVVDGTECVEDYVQFTWAEAVSVNQVVLYNQFSGQAPTAWDILVTADGETWTKAAEISGVEWSENDLEAKTLDFELQENIVGLRVQIKAANLIWGGYTIYGIEIWNAAA